MDRQTVYRGQIVYETDILSGERFAYEGLGLLALDILGTATLVSGVPCNPTGPASLAVVVGAGRIYQKADLEDSAWGSVDSVGGLPLDNNANHQILKQGLLRNPVTLPITPPGTVGFSTNYLIQAALAETDTGSVVLPFFNAADPSDPWAGPDNSGGVLATIRQDAMAINAKPGTAASTGTQTTPAPDAGFVGLYVVTVANGASSVNSGNISVYPGALFITETLTQKIGLTTADARYVKQTDAQKQTYTAFNDTGAANAYVITATPGAAAYTKYQRFSFQAVHANTGASTLDYGHGAVAIVRRDGSPLQAGDIPAGALCDVEYDGTELQLLNAPPNWPRIALTANTSFYVSTTGSDSDTGLSAGHAWLTLQHAYDTILARYDLNGFNADVMLADGTYGAGFTANGAIVGAIGLGALSFQSSSGNPSACIVSCSSGACVTASNGGDVKLQNIKFTNSGGNAFFAFDNSSIAHQGCEFGACSGVQILSRTGARITSAANYTISGTAPTHMQAQYGGIIRQNGNTITLTGTPAFASAFAVADSLGMITFQASPAFSGSATGPRYSAINNGVINTGGAGGTYFPGNSAGADDGHGVYV